MGEHHNENMGAEKFDFREERQTDNSVLPDWEKKLNSMSNEADRAKLVIYMIESGVDENGKIAEKKIECTLATNAEGQLVAFDKKGHNKFILEGRRVEVPAATLEILNKK